MSIHGEPIEEIDSGEPDFGYALPRCTKCGTTTEEIECYVWPLSNEEDKRLGFVYAPVNKDDSVWVFRDNDLFIERVPCPDLTNGITMNGTRYYLNEDGFAPMRQVDGQLSLLDGSVYTANSLEEKELCPLF